MFIKKFEEETNLRCQLLLDISSSMNFPVPQTENYTEINKLRFGALAIASLMNLLKRQRDAYGLSLFDEKVHVNTRCKSSTAHYRLLLSYIEKHVIDFESNKKSSVAEALHEIAESVHRRSLIMIFSDMFQDKHELEKIYSALQHLKYNKHEVVVFHTVDKKLEVDFEFENRPYEMIDLESGEKVRLQSHQVQEHYQRQITGLH